MITSKCNKNGFKEFDLTWFIRYVSDRSVGNQIFADWYLTFHWFVILFLLFDFEKEEGTQLEPQPVGRDQEHLSVLLPVVLNFEMQFREIDV